MLDLKRISCVTPASIFCFLSPWYTVASELSLPFGCLSRSFRARKQVYACILRFVALRYFRLKIRPSFLSRLLDPSRKESTFSFIGAFSTWVFSILMSQRFAPPLVVGDSLSPFSGPAKHTRPCCRQMLDLSDFVASCEDCVHSDLHPFSLSQCDVSLTQTAFFLFFLFTSHVDFSPMRPLCKICPLLFFFWP